MNSKNLIEKRIAQVKAKLLVEQPYFGTLSSTQKSKPNDELKTFASTPEFFEYNDEYIEMLSDEELGFLLTNSAMHQAFSHAQRKEGRQEWLWVMAQDYAINSLLVNNGLEIPPDILYDERFDLMSAEAIYSILESEIDEDKHTPKEVENIRYEKMPQTNEYDQDGLNQEEFQNENRQKLNEQILEKSKQYGDLPLGIEVLVPNILEGQISWQEELYTVIENSVKFDYSLLPPNKRYAHLGIALPSLSGTLVKIVIAIDSSNSIDQTLLGSFLGEVESIMNSFENYEIDLLIADAKVQEHHILYPGDILNYTLKGGGGTNFEATFEYIEENISDITLFLYFTDGMGTFPTQEPDYDVIWVMPKDSPDIPFGRSILI
jgi:predicted metal-dependent peptidase